jgi:hypothetical protein
MLADEEELPEGFVRLVVPLDEPPDKGGPEFEWVWAEPLGNDRYRVENSPFFAYGLSYDDVVRAAPDGPDAELQVQDVERKSGHRTLRLALDARFDIAHPEVRQFLDELLDLGCTYEGLPPKLVALDVPPELDVAKVVERLQAPFRDGVLLWEWADPRRC